MTDEQNSIYGQRILNIFKTNQFFLNEIEFILLFTKTRTGLGGKNRKFLILEQTVYCAVV